MGIDPKQPIDQGKLRLALHQARRKHGLTGAGGALDLSGADPSSLHLATFDESKHPRLHGRFVHARFDPAADHGMQDAGSLGTRPRTAEDALTKHIQDMEPGSEVHLPGGTRVVKDSGKGYKHHGVVSHKVTVVDKHGNRLDAGHEHGMAATAAVMYDKAGGQVVADRKGRRVLGPGGRPLQASGQTHTDLNLDAIQFDPHKHPRGFKGQFRAVVNGLKPGQSVNLPSGTTVSRLDTGNPHGRILHVTVSPEHSDHRGPHDEGARGTFRGLTKSAGHGAADLALEYDAKHEPGGKTGDKKPQTLTKDHVATAMAEMDPYGDGDPAGWHGFINEDVVKAANAGDEKALANALNKADDYTAYPGEPDQGGHSEQAKALLGRLRGENWEMTRGGAVNRDAKKAEAAAKSQYLDRGYAPRTDGLTPDDLDLISGFLLDDTEHDTWFDSNVAGMGDVESKLGMTNPGEDPHTDNPDAGKPFTTAEWDAVLSAAKQDYRNAEDKQMAEMGKEILDKFGDRGTPGPPAPTGGERKQMADKLIRPQARGSVPFAANRTEVANALNEMQDGDTRTFKGEGDVPDFNVTKQGTGYSLDDGSGRPIQTESTREALNHLVDESQADTPIDAGAKAAAGDPAAISDEDAFHAVTSAVDRLASPESQYAEDFTGAADEIRDIHNAINDPKKAVSDGLDYEAETTLQEILDATERSSDSKDQALNKWANDKMGALNKEQEAVDAAQGGGIPSDAYQQLYDLADGNVSQIDSQHPNGVAFENADNAESWDIYPSGDGQLRIDYKDGENGSHDGTVTADDWAHAKQRIENMDYGAAAADAQGQSAQGDPAQTFDQNIGIDRVQVDNATPDAISFNLSGGDDEVHDYQLRKASAIDDAVVTAPYHEGGKGDGEWVLSEYPLDAYDEETDQYDVEALTHTALGTTDLAEASKKTGEILKDRAGSTGDAVPSPSPSPSPSAPDPHADERAKIVDKITKSDPSKIGEADAQAIQAAVKSDLPDGWVYSGGDPDGHVIFDPDGHAYSIDKHGPNGQWRFAQLPMNGESEQWTGDTPSAAFKAYQDEL